MITCDTCGERIDYVSHVLNDSIVAGTGVKDTCDKCYWRIDVAYKAAQKHIKEISEDAAREKLLEIIEDYKNERP